MLNSILRASEAVTSTQAVALREMRKVYGRGDGSVVASTRSPGYGDRQSPRESSARVGASGGPTVEGGELSTSRSRLTVALNVGPQLSDQG
jgi:hypothetical protein